MPFSIGWCSLSMSTSPVHPSGCSTPPLPCWSLRRKDGAGGKCSVMLCNQSRGQFSWTLWRCHNFLTEEEVWARPGGTKTHCGHERKGSPRSFFCFPTGHAIGVLRPFLDKDGGRKEFGRFSPSSGRNTPYA